MSAEISHQTSDHDPHQSCGLEEFLRFILEQHDGFCLDNESERVQLAANLAAALVTAAGDFSMHRSFLPVEGALPNPLHQTYDSSVSTPLLE
mgnify:CR=1 FL=1